MLHILINVETLVVHFPQTKGSPLLSSQVIFVHAWTMSSSIFYGSDRNRIKTHVKLQQQFLPILNFVLCDSLWLWILTRTQFLMNLTQISQVSYIKLNTGFKQQVADLWTPKGTIFLQFPSTIVQKIRN
jgi:hypothetical protein